MKIQKSIQLTTKPLEEIIENGQSLDFRLDTDVWRDLQVGDNVEFWEDFTGWQVEPLEKSRKIVVKIKGIYRAPTFTKLFGLIEEEFEKIESKENLLNGLRSWWSEDKETKSGVLAFHVILIG